MTTTRLAFQLQENVKWNRPNHKIERNEAAKEKAKTIRQELN